MTLTLLDPRFWLAAVVWTALVGGTSYLAGHLDATEKAELEANARAVEAIQAVIDDNAKTLDRERTLRALDHAAHQDFARKQEVAKDETNRLIAGLRTGAVRLRAPITNSQSCAPASGQAAAGSGAQGYAELGQDAAVQLVGLLERGDTGIRKHAEVVDRYERLRLACAGNSTTTNEGTTP